MNRKWFGITALIAAAISLLSIASCGDPQELTSITIQPSVETFGASNIPLSADAGASVQLRALGTFIHPPVTKDITNQVTWTSNDTQMFTINSTGLLTVTGIACGGSLISATVTTNKDSGGLSATGAIVTGSMTANVVCFTSSGGGGGGSGPTVTVSFGGPGTGTVNSSPSGIICASTDTACVGTFATGATVVLTAIPIGTAGMTWSGSCDSIAGDVCTIASLSTDVGVMATFN